jgi:putative ABC transport system permease protein
VIRALRRAGPSWVIFRAIVGEAGASLRGRRMQAALSAFGIATGIAAVVLLVSIVSGIHRYALENIGSAGGNVIQVSPMSDRSTRDPRGFPVTLRASDVDAVLAGTGYFDRASAENSANGVVRTVRRSTQGASLRGMTPDGFAILNLQVNRGRTFLDTEYEHGARVAVLGADVARDLFAQESPLGQTIVLGDWPFQVVGVLEWVGDPEGGLRSFQDEIVYVPFRACAAAFRGNDIANTLRLRLKDPATGEDAVVAAKAVLDRERRRRGETSGDFRLNNTVEQLRLFTEILTAIKVLVGLVGGIGLFVGAVGVANVLLVSVRERTQEIGVRRAIGATRRAIFLGFLLEALAITLAGGIVGIVIAFAMTKIAIFIPQVPAGARPHISLLTAVTAVALLALVGIIAGVGPARRAARVFPAEALRAE